MKNRIVSAVLALLMLASMLSFGTMGAFAADGAVIASGTCGENLTWQLDDGGLLTISGSGEMSNFKQYGSPWNNNRNKITNLQIENGVTSIGGHAFDGCDNLISVTIPDSVITITRGAFWNCRSLTSVTIGKGVNAVNGEAFFSSKITNITVAEENQNYTSIDGILYNKDKSSLIIYPAKKADTEFTVPDSVTSIADNAFYSCSKLASITIPNGVTSIGKSAFNSCSSLKDVYYFGNEAQWNGISIGTNNNYLKNANFHFILPVASGYCGGEGDGTNLSWEFYEQGKLVIYGNGSMENYSSSNRAPWYDNRNNITNITIKNGVTSVGGYAFENCDKFTNVTIPDSVVNVNTGAFQNCHGLTNIIIGKSVNSINADAFYSAGLKNITVAEENKNYTSVDGVLYSKDKSKLLIYPAKKIDTEFVVLDTVTSIAPDAFRCCSKLSRITIPNSVTSIGNYAFIGCDNLTNITIPNSVTSIGNGAFQGCSKLTSITISGNITTIGLYTFYGCTGLTSIIIPHSVTYINKDAFKNCSNNLTIYCHADSYAENYAIEKGLKHNSEAHNYINWHDERDFSCTENRTQIGTCEICGHEGKRDAAPKGHDYGEWFIEKGKYCTDGYTQTRCCKHCDHSETQTVGAKDHDYGEWKRVKDPGLFKHGEDRRHCSKCGYEQARDVPQLNFFQWFVKIFKSLFGLS